MLTKVIGKRLHTTTNTDNREYPILILLYNFSVVKYSFNSTQF